jgi:hypothetical protein
LGMRQVVSELHFADYVVAGAEAGMSMAF